MNQFSFILCALVLVASPAKSSAGAPSIEEGRKHWAFQPLVKSDVPAVKDSTWVRNDVDRFVLSRLDAAGLKPSPQADRATLIRRVTFDLIGLPPAPAEVEAFVKDSSPQAIEKVIDRLLDSPLYGERWGRHWLDLARYADTCGFHNDLDRPHAWKYRDYVIDSFNDDKPYARFIAEQLAGDEVEGADEQTIIATGFCRNGPSNDDNMGKTPEALAQYYADQMDDVISTTSSVFLGLTVGCARCHDHKTDPILARDYYSLFAVFRGAEKIGMATRTKGKQESDVMAFVEKQASPPKTFILQRGLAASPGDQVEPAVPIVLTRVPMAFPKAEGKTSQRRLRLAEWIGSAENALTWRVMANRVWQHHFGAGIVASPSNFGFTGNAPTHPELLDFLASALIANGGHLKPLHKMILLSATYRQSSDAHDPQAIAVDPGNLLLWRMNKQRMEAEVLRDSILAVSGKLNLKRGGPGIKPRIRAELLDASQRNKWPTMESEGPEQWRRSVYIYVKRQLLMPSMELFDAPTTTDSCALRLQSTVPTQALVLMNDEFVEDQAGFLADRAQTEAGGEISQVVDRLFQLTLGRAVDSKRRGEAMSFVSERESVSSRQEALTDLAHVLLNSSEFVYIE
ncbi:MAG: DUF1549 domain-containing protein [Verrucomicrobiales bacterium]|nr:DUF1549 domain-containing protein [Verrucomicrobiales bacterium]MCP5558325.1 DUF1549 domain-containing protein [Verrucomicrobiaceae bacterium]